MTMRRSCRTFLLAGLAVLAACASAPPYQPLAQPVPISRVIQDLGNDYRRSELDENRTSYTWSWTKKTLVTTQPPPSVPVQGSSPVIQAVNVSCNVSVIADANGQVVATRTVGSGCGRILGTDFWLK